MPRVTARAAQHAAGTMLRRQPLRHTHRRHTHQQLPDAAEGAPEGTEQRRARFAEAMRLSRAPAPAPAVEDTRAAGPIHERRGKLRRGGMWWSEEELMQHSAAAVKHRTEEEAQAVQERYRSMMALSRAPPPQPREQMVSKPDGFGFNAVMGELDQLTGKQTRYPLFERQVHEATRAVKPPPPTGPRYDDDGGLDLSLQDADGYDGVAFAPQRRDYWPAAELRMLRQARAELASDPLHFAPSDTGADQAAAEWDAVSGWLAMQGYNRSGVECAAASAADDAATNGAGGEQDVDEDKPSPAEQKAAEQAALLKRHSQETLNLVKDAGGKLTPILSESDSALASQLRAEAAAAVADMMELVKASPQRCRPGANALATRVEAAAARIISRSGLLEREREARILLLAALASEHLLIFGPSGTGKTTLCREMASLFVSPSDPVPRLFERLVTRFTVPEEVLGPLSLSALRDDTHSRLSDGYLGTASMAFLDEIFKASSSLLNCLLEILADRRISEGPGQAAHAPLVCMVGAASTLPDEALPGGELAALFDRFLLRVTLRPLTISGRLEAIADAGKEDDRITEMLQHETHAAFTVSEAAQLRQQSRTVELPTEVLALVEDIAETEASLAASCATSVGPGEPAPGTGYVSDRRLVACSALLRLVAHTAGRSAVHAIDCVLLRHCLPQHDAAHPDSADRVTETVVAACAVPTSAAEAVRSGVALQQQLLAHLANAPSHHPAHGSSRDWRTRPAGVLAAAVGAPPDGATPSQMSQVHDETLSDMHQQLGTTVESLGGIAAALRRSCADARVVLLSHPWLSPAERSTIAQQLEVAVATHESAAAVVQLELAALDRWLARTPRESRMKQLPAVLSLMPAATARVLEDLLSPTSSAAEQRCGLRLVHQCGFHVSACT